MTHLYLLFTGGTEEACLYACIISEEENSELEKALKVSATPFSYFISSYLNISPWDWWYVILLMGIIYQKTSQMNVILFLFVKSLKEKCSII